MAIASLEQAEVEATTRRTIRVLYVENDVVDFEWVRRSLQKAPALGFDVRFELDRAVTLADAIERLPASAYDIVLLDLGLTDGMGLATFDEIHAGAPQLPAIVYTGTVRGERRALDALGRGAQDCLFKGEIDARTLIRSICYAIERKRIEDALQAANQALEAEVQRRKHAESQLAAKNRELETLLYVSAHDLREPLRAIVSFAGMIQSQAAAVLDERMRDRLVRILRAATRMDEVMNDLMTLAKIDRFEFLPEKVDGREVVREAIEALRETIERQQARVKVEDGLPSFAGNRIWSTQAVQNLLSNALKFVQAGHAPEIEIGPYEPRQGEPRQIGIVVRDRGPGVPEDLRERIFDFLQRGVGREVEGTGAGLAIVRSVAARHGGHTWVRPRERGGSEFVITFGDGPGT